jgi:glutathione S-transferase
MNLDLHQPALRLFVVASALVVLTLFGLAFRTGGVRAAAKAVVNPEDVKVYRGAGVVDVEHATVQRIKRAHLNLIENAIPFLSFGFLYALTDPNEILEAILFFGFVAVRWLHVYCYLGGRQPGRAATFAASVVINGVLVLLVLRAAFF